MFRVRLQFRLRTLMLTVFVCGICCSYFARPTLTASRFVTAISTHDYAKVDELLVEDRNWATDAQLDNIQLELAPLTIRQLIRGERWFTGYVPRGERMEDYNWVFVLRVKETGVKTFLILH